MTESYPLHWPIGKPRSRSSSAAAFKGSQNDTQNFLMHEIRLLGGKNIIISTNIELRLDGLPYASRREPEDKGVAVYFMYEGNQQCFSCDRWDKIKDNLKAIAKTIEALRGIGRWGSGDMVRAAFQGFQALPAPIEAGQPWYSVLNCDADATKETIKKAYYTKAKQYYGDHEKMIEINQAYEMSKSNG